MRRILLAAACLAAGAPLQAQRTDSAAFIIRLGNDTTVVERYIRTANQITIEAVQRSPSTVVHRLVLELTPTGAVTSGDYSAQRPGVAGNLGQRKIAVPPGHFVVAGPFFATYELAMMHALGSGKNKTDVRMLTAQDTVVIPFERVGRDSLTLTNQFGEPMRAHVDESGRLLHLHTPAYVTVERVKWLDLDAVTREFAARDAAGKGLGPLSPRYAARHRVGSANVWVDYSRPAARGRPIWGGLVPHGKVWRMGANDAAHISFDKPIEVGGVTLQPGTYTLFLLPAANEWTLIFNRRTGISGLDHDEKQDAARVKLELQTLERPAEQFTIDARENAGGGVLGVAWGGVRGTVPFTVK